MEAANSFKTANYMLQDQSIPMKMLPARSCQHNVESRIGYSNNKMSKKETVLSAMNKLAKGKLSLNAKILQIGGAEKMLRRIFELSEGEQLLKASQCSLFTTAGALTGRLFVSTEKLAFCSDKAIAKYTSSSGETLRYHYKVVIPLNKVQIATQISENAMKPSKKYLQVVTMDNFEFWFTGLLNYNRTVKCLQQALSQEA